MPEMPVPSPPEDNGGRTPQSGSDIDAFLAGRGFGTSDMKAMAPEAEVIPEKAAPAVGNLLSMPKFPEVPKLHDIPKAPQTEMQDPIRQFGGPAMFLAAMGSLMTRRPMVTAMNAATAAINGDVQGQKDQAKLSRENWALSVKQAIEQNNVETTRYQEIMLKYKNDQQQMQSHLMAMAAGFEDHNMIAMIKSGVPFDKVWNLNEDKIKRAREAQAATDKHEEHEEKMKRAQTGQMSDEALHNLAERHLNGDPSAMRAIGRASQTNPNYARFQNTVAELARERGISPEKQGEMMQQFQSAQKLENSFSTGREGQMVRSMNATIEHLHTAEKLFEALNNKDVQAFNKWGNEWNKQTGQPAPFSFEAARNIIGAEIVKAIVPGGGGVTERLEAAKGTLSSASSPQQAKAVLGTVRELLGGQLGALEKQWTSNPMHNAKDFEERFLTDNSRKELLKASGTATASEPGKKDLGGGWSVEVH